MQFRRRQPGARQRIRDLRVTAIAWAVAAPTIIALAAASLSPSPAVANEFCVVCEEPQAIYRCAAPAGGQGVQRSLAGLACTQHIASGQGHARCAVRLREAACDAPLVVLPEMAGLTPPPLATAPPAGGALPQAIPQVGATAPVQDGWTTAAPGVAEGAGAGKEGGAGASLEPVSPPAENAASEQAPPRTLVEATKRAWEQSGTAIEKAGDSINDTGRSIGNAAGGAWRCLTTLFSDCE